MKKIQKIISNIKKNIKMKEIQKLISNIKIGFVQANNLPLLPKNINDFTNSLIGRGLRVIGGISLLASMNIFNNYDYLEFSELEKNIIVVWGLMFICYYLIINIIQTYYILEHLRSKSYIVKNSPINNVASTAGKLLLCIRGVCQAGGVAGSGLGLGMGTD
jgi:hypothetical protein